MRHSIVSLIGPSKWSGEIGKETSDTSFSIRALKHDESIVTILNPSRYPEKLWSLLFPLSLTDTVYLKIEKIDRELGETIIALDLAGIEKGKCHLSEMIDVSRFRDLIKGTVLEKWGHMDPDPAALREELLGITNEYPEDPPAVVVDQSFPVKGVGTVVLGFVISGTIEKHQELMSYPTGRRSNIRSIQIHDRDQKEANAGARVGLALKNIDPEDLPRGSVLSTPKGGIEVHDLMEIDLRTSDYWKEPLVKGRNLHLWSSLQFVPVTVEEAGEPMKENGHIRQLVKVRPESPVWALPSSRFGLAHLDSKSFRFFAVGETI